MASSLSRRTFIRSSVAAAAGGPAQAPLGEPSDGPALRAGLVGCGGRGTGAAFDFLQSARNVRIVALADVFEDQVARARATLESKGGQEIPASRCYTGFDAFEELVAGELDVVLLAAPPHFRPAHFAAAVAAGRHVFMETPLAVDPVGIRAVLATGEKASSLGLSVVAGAQRRHHAGYQEVRRRIAGGAIGDLVAARARWNQGQPGYRSRDAAWSDMEWMLRDWVNWTWLSGDHIVEQHVHNLDVIHWFTASHPVRASAMGGRMRRVTGDQYDFFATDYAFASGMHSLSQARQMSGCANDVSEFLVGTHGSTNCADTIFDGRGNVVWRYQGPRVRPYVQEHIELVSAIRSGRPINEVRDVAESTLVAIMGRVSAYTGREVTWDEILTSNLRLGPTSPALGRAPIGSHPTPGGAEPTA